MLGAEIIHKDPKIAELDAIGLIIDTENYWMHVLSTSEANCLKEHDDEKR